MMDFTDIQTVIADTWFGGAVDMAGLVMFIAIMLVVFSLAKHSLYVGFIIMLPVTLMFASMGILSSEFTIILVIVAVLGLATSVRRTVE